MNDTDIWRTAHAMIREYGAGAGRCAIYRAERLWEEGIPDGALEWERIAAAIAELERKAPGSDEKLN